MSNAQEIVQLIAKLKKTPSGSLHYNVSKKLNRLCLDNPKVVASLVLDSATHPGIRDRLLFQYSSDHGGSCSISDNPNWARMMRQFIIPNLSKLPFMTQRRIKWYQKTHGL